MGTTKLGLTVMVLILSFFICMPSVTALAQPEDLGEICIEFPGGTNQLRLHVLSYGTDTFQLVGKMPGPGNHLMPVHGAAVLEGNNVLRMTLNASGDLVYSETEYFEIDLSNALSSGTWTSIYTMQVIETNPSPGAPGFTTRTASGTFSFCQSP